MLRMGRPINAEGHAKGGLKAGNGASELEEPSVVVARGSSELAHYYPDSGIDDKNWRGFLAVGWA